MASIKAIAAIALTLMIAVPIGLGYAFASETVTSTSYEAGETASIGSLLQNDWYYTYDEDFQSPMNNMFVVQGTGSYEYGSYTDSTNYKINQVSYVTGNSTTVSSYPDYTITESQMTGDNGNHTYVTYAMGNGAGETRSIGTTSDASVVLSGHVFYLSIANPIFYSTLTLYTDDDNEFVSGPARASILQSGDGVYDAEVYDMYGTKYTYYDIDSWILAVNASLSVDVSYSSQIPVDMPLTSDYQFTTAYSGMSFYLVYTDGSTEWVAATYGKVIRYSSTYNTLYVNDDAYAGLSHVWYVSAEGLNYLPYFTATASASLYYSVEKGWTVPKLFDSSSPDYNKYISTWWYNGQQNHTLGMWVRVPATTGILTMQPCQDFSTDPYNDNNCIQMKRESNGVYAKLSSDNDWTYLGSYTTFYVKFNYFYCTIYCTADYGATGYPDFDDISFLHGKSFELDHDSYDVEGKWFFNYLRIEQMNSDNYCFRMDEMYVTTGTRTQVSDKPLAIDRTFPGSSVILSFKNTTATVYNRSSLAVGDTLYYIDYASNLVGTSTFSDGGGWGFEFTDLDGDTHVASLRGFKVSFVYDDSTEKYDLYIDGYQVAENSQASYLVFGGTWEIDNRSTASLLTPTTTTSEQWAPGVFAFDKEDFAACGLLVAGACLIGLGMHGSRSGTKMGLLLIICGGAGLIYLTIL